MKIGIFTLPLHTNYGGILQAYALQQVLKNNGHDAWLINQKRFSPPFWRKVLSIIKRIIYRYVFRKKEVIVLYEEQYKSNFKIISKNTQKFIDKFIQPQTSPLFSNNDLNGLKKLNFDAIIVGSDQVWRAKYTPKIENYYLDFLPQSSNCKKISYAASFGTDNWEYTTKQTIKCARLLQKFSCISVRESSAIKLCKEKFDANVEHVLDPTMLISPKDYINLIGEKEKLAKNVLTTYILDSSDEKEEIIEFFASSLRLRRHKINSKTEDHSALLEDRIAPSVENWIAGFYSADFVIIDSFHGCVFSILFNKPFYVIGNSTRGMARFDSLLKIFNLENRLIFSLNDIPPQSIHDEIDWNEVNKILQFWQNKSYRYLMNALR
nr:polysaccharide pyruvyl transferase family protein [uncultured Draconibacterium sp.]